MTSKPGEAGNGRIRTEAASRLPAGTISAGAGRTRIGILGGVVLLFFLANGRTVTSGDNFGTRALAASLAGEGSWELSPAIGGEPAHYSTIDIGDRRLVAYPAGTGFLAAPIYAVSGWVTKASAAQMAASEGLEKLAAALLSTAAVLIFFLGLRRRVTESAAFAGSLLVACGTPMLTTMSQGLWSYTGETLALATMLCLAMRGAGGGAAPLLAGIAMGIAQFCRPTAFLLAALPLVCFRRRRERILFIASAGLGGLAVTLFNLHQYGTFLGAYGALNLGGVEQDFAGMLRGFAGVLFSPSRGLVWTFPLLAGLLVAAGLGRHDARERLELLGIAATVGLILLLTGSRANWWGGQSVGPRLLSELALPCGLAFALFLSRGPDPGKRWWAWALAAAQSFLFLALHLSPRASSWSVAVAVNANPGVLWSWRSSELAAVLRPGWTYFETGTYFDESTLLDARSGHSWTPIDLSATANARYDLPVAARSGGSASDPIHLPRLVEQPPPSSAHLRVLPPGRDNVVRVCRGESSKRIELSGAGARKIDTLVLWRGDATRVPRGGAAGRIAVEFSNGKTSNLELRFGSQILQRHQIDLQYARQLSRFYAGKASAPDALQRQRFTLPGKNRSLESLAVEVPADGPEGCLFLLAISLGVAEVEKPSE